MNQEEEAVAGTFTKATVLIRTLVPFQKKAGAGSLGNNMSFCFQSVFHPMLYKLQAIYRPGFSHT